jgi:methyl-accepting chemotaxis protein
MGLKKNVKVSMIHSIKLKIVLVVVMAVLATTSLCLGMIIPMVEESLSEVTKHYMIDMTDLAGVNLDREIEALGGETVLTPEGLGNAVGSIDINGMNSSYAYVVGADGTMLYHPTVDKIGQPVENDAVKQVLGEVVKGNRLATDVIAYEFKGVTKYASYYIGEDMEYVIVVTADESEVFAGITEIVSKSLYGSFFILILCSAIGFLVAMRIVKPIERITAIISQLADLNFVESKWQAYINKRKDETGIMGRAIESLRNALTGVTKNIADHSENLYNASNTMTSSAQEASLSVEQVEKAISEIAQGATSQAQDTQTATENIILMGNMIEETSTEVDDLRENARIMRNAGDKAIDILNELNQINQQTKEAVFVISEQTNTTNESALKIKEATDMIADIAEETNLLSLNASIEAARAGEQGRGFAVVAAQIQKLAEQSNESARQIDGIINSLIADSEKAVDTMEEVKVVIEKQNENVINTENAFKDVKDGIDKSMKNIQEITDKTKQLDDARIKVVDVVQNLTAIAQENAASTEETSASASEVGTIVEDIANNARKLNTIAGEMEESIKMFVME